MSVPAASSENQLSDEPLLDGSAIHIESHPARPAYSTQRHAHLCDSLFLIVDGRGECIVDTQQHALEPMTALFVEAGVHHAFIDKAGSAMTTFVVNFDKATSLANQRLLETIPSPRVPQQIPIHVWQKLRLLLRQMLHEQNMRPPHYEMAIQNLLTSVLLQLSRVYMTQYRRESPHKSSSSQRVRAVLDYTANTYYHSHSLPLAAKMAQLSERRFSTLCRQISGQSFVQYVNALRVERARELLETTSLPVAAIAFQMGFEELSTFYRAFRKHTGQSPREINR